jgi:hypothetical protein
MGCGIGCGSALLLGGLVLLVLLHKVTAVPPEVARMREAPPPASSGAPAQPAPAPYETQRQEIEQAARSSSPTPVTLRLTEAQMNDLIAQNAGRNAEVQDVRVAFTGGDLLLTGTTNWRGRQVYITAVGRPQAVSGQPRFQLSSVRLGTLAMPASGVAKLQAEIDRGMADWSAENPYDVTDVSIYDGQLVVQGTTRPR